MAVAAAIPVYPDGRKPKQAWRVLVGTLSNGYSKSVPLPIVAPFKAPIAKLTRALAAHLSTIISAPYLGMVFGEHIT